MSTAIENLLAILDLEPLEVNLFRGRSPQVGWQRVFGGQVIGQALVAACRTVEDVAHGRRIRCTPISCSAAIPRCRSSMRSTASATARASRPAASSRSSTARPYSRWRCRFTATSRGWSTRPGCRTCRSPRNCRTRPRSRSTCCRLMPEPVRRYYERERPIELRPVEYRALSGQEVRGRPFQRLDPRHRHAAGRTGDPSMRARLCVRHDAARRGPDPARPHRVREDHHGREPRSRALVSSPVPRRRMAAVCPGQPNLSGSRGFSRGLIFARDGTLVASVAQEGLVRERTADDAERKTGDAKPGNEAAYAP